MTLTEWINAGPVMGQCVPFQRTGTGQLQVMKAHTLPDPHMGYVVADVPRDDRAKAWRLTDFRVTSVSGGSLWLAPKW